RLRLAYEPPAGKETNCGEQHKCNLNKGDGVETSDPKHLREENRVAERAASGEWKLPVPDPTQGWAQISPDVGREPQRLVTDRPPDDIEDKGHQGQNVPESDGCWRKRGSGVSPSRSAPSHRIAAHAYQNWNCQQE